MRGKHDAKCFLRHVFLFEWGGSEMEKLFHLAENGTTVRREVSAGVTTFFAMAYIIFVNPVFLSAAGMDPAGVMIATCLGAAAGSVLCAVISNLPYAMAPGMGLNTFFAFTLCGSAMYAYRWQQALALTFIAGGLFLLITLTPLRDRIIAAVPANLQHAIAAGIGLFIALIGLLNAGLIVMTDGFPALGDLRSPQALLTVFGVAVTAVLMVLKVPAPLLLGMAATVAAGLLSGQVQPPEKIVSLPGALSEVFCKLDFHGLVRGGAGGVVGLAALLFSMTMVDMFDTLGFLIGAGSQTGEGTLSPRAGEVLTADALATVLGAVCGTSTVTTYAESAAGVSAGGRTGLTSLVTAAGFLLALFFSPLAELFTAAAAAPALIMVGMFLTADVRKVDFSRTDEAIPAFLTILLIPLSYSITTGIGAGFIAWAVCKAVGRSRRELSPMAAVLAGVFALYFIL